MLHATYAYFILKLVFWGKFVSKQKGITQRLGSWISRSFSDGLVFLWGITTIENVQCCVVALLLISQLVCVCVCVCVSEREREMGS